MAGCPYQWKQKLRVDFSGTVFQGRIFRDGFSGLIFQGRVFRVDFSGTQMTDIFDSSAYKPSEGKNYVALVTGLHERYLLERQFLRNPDPEKPQQWLIPTMRVNGLILDIHGNYVQYMNGHWKPITLGKVLAYLKRQGQG